jgi:ABC-type multidrug transport system fused ATPase/permease subunit
MFYLSRRAAVVSSNLVSRVLSQSLLALRKKPSQETLFALTSGVDFITMGVIGTTIYLVADISLLVVLSLGLFVVNPVLAGLTTGAFSAVGFVLFRIMRSRARDLGSKVALYGYSANKKILEALQTYREAILRGSRSYYIDSISTLRYKLSNTTAELSFMPLISKYVFESSVVVGALVLSAIQFSREDATRAVATLAIFLAAATRIAPAVLRLQQGLISIKSAMGSASQTFSLIDNLVEEHHLASTEKIEDFSLFKSKVQIRNLSFDYGIDNWSLKDINLEIDQGDSIAITGPSGAGKTTLIDIILGIIDPSEGEVLISNVPSRSAVRRWPGAIAYVPQDIYIIEGTIRENVALGKSLETISDNDVWEALERAHLADFVRSLPGNINEDVGEFGNKLSGGQRQRLGIARALYTKPQLLVLDEATSALDNETESLISQSLKELKGRVTVVMIAHRLSSVRMCDKVAYLENGSLVSCGSFEEVRNKVPNFDKQARLLEL